MPTDIDTDYEWFKDRLADKRLSQSGLARLLDMDKSSLSLLLHGRRRMRIEVAADIARVLGVTVSDVMKHGGASVEGLPDVIVSERVLPLTGWIDENWRVHEVDGQTFTCPVTIEIPAGGRVYQWRTANSQMSSMDGWLVVTGGRRKAEPDTLHDRWNIVELADGERLIGSIRRAYQPGKSSVYGVASIIAADVDISRHQPIIMAMPG